MTKFNWDKLNKLKQTSKKFEMLEGDLLPSERKLIDENRGVKTYTDTMENIDKGYTKKYNTNLAAEFHVLSMLHRFGYEATLKLGNKKAVDIFIFKPDGKTITIDVKGVAMKYDWPIDNLKVDGKGGHYIVLVCFNKKIKDPNKSPSVWVVPSRDIKMFIKEYKKRTVVSRKKIVNEGKKYFQAWDALG